MKQILIVDDDTSVLSVKLPWWNAERHLAKPFGIDARRSAVTELIGAP
jgi:hypothetical protein